MSLVLVAHSVQPTSHVPAPLRTKSRQQLQQLDAGCSAPLSKLRNNLYIGSRDVEQDLAALQAAGVTHILQAGVELAPSHPGQFAYEHLTCSDTETQDIISLFQTAFRFIDEGGKQGRFVRAKRLFHLLQKFCCVPKRKLLPESGHAAVRVEAVLTYTCACFAIAYASNDVWVASNANSVGCCCLRGRVPNQQLTQLPTCIHHAVCPSSSYNMSVDLWRSGMSSWGMLLAFTHLFGPSVPPPPPRGSLPHTPVTLLLSLHTHA